MAGDLSYKYVLIKSLLGDNSYLDIEGAKTHPGTNVVTWSRNGDKNQIWYYDEGCFCFRSKLNDFCLEYLPGKNSLVVNPCNPHNPYQKMLIHLPYIKLQADDKLNVAIINDDRSKGAHVSALRESNDAGQKWTFEDAGGYAPRPTDFTPSDSNIGGAFGGQEPKMHFQRREFLISSAMPGDLVVDIKGDNAKAGASVIVYPSNRKKNQLWYADQDGFVRSSLNDMVFHGNSKGSSLEMTPYMGDRKHQWRIEGRKVVNGEGHCLDIRGAKGRKGDDLCAYDYKSQDNQHWNFLY